MIPRTRTLNWLLMLVGSILGSAFLGCNLDRLRISPKVPKELLLTSGRSFDPAKSGVDLTLVEPEEVDLVEAVITHRDLYRYRLRQLKDYYAARGYAAKESWAAFELNGLKKVQPFRYLLDGEVPQVGLEPKESVAEADALYQRGLELMRKGGHDVPIVYRQDTMIEAAQVLRELITRYPTSDKIDDAAFLLGEIHKSYLPGQEAIAVKWYERAWTWNPQTPHPARFEAAVVSDYRLRDRDRALELYQEVVQAETGNASNLRFAQRRIGELTADR